MILHRFSPSRVFSFNFTYKRSRYFLLIGIFFLLFAAWSCQEEPGFIGLEVLPDSDRPILGYSKSTRFKAFSFTVDSVQSNNYSIQLLGDLNDPVFGNSRVDFFSKMVMSSYGFNFGNNAQLDSVFLYLRLINTYGDRTSPLMINIFELTDTIHFDSAYYNNLDPGGFYNPANPVESYLYSSPGNDTLIKVPITNSYFTRKLFEIDSVSKANERNFQRYFPGLYITAQRQSDPGLILSVGLNNFNSRIVLHYHNDRDTLAYNFYFGNFAAKVNLFRHNYSTTDFYSKLNQTIIQDTVVYVQSMGGLAARIKSENLIRWRDSVPVAINRARLVIPSEENDLSSAIYKKPDKLILLRKDENGKFHAIKDSELGIGYFGGTYNSELKAYTFNITREVQRIVNGVSDELDLYLLVNEQVTTANRVVLTSGNHSRPISLEITYQKF